MNPPPAELLQVVHAGVTNPYSYTLNGALGLQSTQLKPDPNVVLCPTYLGKTEVMDSSSLLCRPGHVDQPYSSAGHTLVPTCIGPAYAPAHLTHINHLDSRDKHYNRQIQHHSCVISGTIVAATGPAKAGNRTFRANPSSVSQKKGYDNCEPRICLYPGPNGTLCSQEITCATVPKHFVSHGITHMRRDKVIPCQWYGCSEGLVRHNFVRHVRETHLGHVRGSTTHNSEKERGRCAFDTESVEVEMSRLSGHV